MSNVLVVDDDAEIRESLGLLLADEGYQVAVAEGGMHALDLLRYQSDHVSNQAVVLFDFLMPHGDGLDLLRGVAGDAGLQRHYAYICMAAHQQSRLPEEFRLLMDALGVPFIAKPFDVDEVLTAIDTAHRRMMVSLETKQG